MLWLRGVTSSSQTWIRASIGSLEAHSSSESRLVIKPLCSDWHRVLFRNIATLLLLFFFFSTVRAAPGEEALFLSTSGCTIAVLHANEIFVKHMKLKQLSEGIRVAAGGAVDYLPFVWINVGWRGGLTVSLFIQRTRVCVQQPLELKKKRKNPHHSLVCFRCNTLPSRRTLKNSRLVCKKDDVHVCIMCLRAIMNYQVSLSSWPRPKQASCPPGHLSNWGQIEFVPAFAR